MQAKRILKFLSDIKLNNNREWFTANKDEYQAVRKDFEKGVNSAIARISEFDPSIRHLTAKDAMYRFNRDTRFSLVIRLILEHTSPRMAKRLSMAVITYILNRDTALCHAVIIIYPPTFLRHAATRLWLTSTNGAVLLRASPLLKCSVNRVKVDGMMKKDLALSTLRRHHRVFRAIMSSYNT